MKNNRILKKKKKMILFLDFFLQESLRENVGNIE